MPLNREDWKRYQEKVYSALQDAAITVTPQEREEIEIADFGLGNFEKEGLGLVVYVNTDRTCAKELVLLPGQTCPQHRHPPVEGEPGKEETFRVRRGVCYLYVDDGPAAAMHATPPTAFYQPLREVVLQPGDQYTLKPNTWHWFQAGPEGAVVSEFSTKSRDEADIFLDPNVKRIPVIAE